MHRTARILILIFLLSLISPSLSLATNVAPDDPAYEVLRNLDARGVIKGSVSSTLPLSRKEVARLIEEAERAGSLPPHERASIEYLKSSFKEDIERGSYARPLDSLSVRFAYLADSSERLNYNNDGEPYRDGSNMGISLVSRAELKNLSFYLEPEVRGYGDTDAVLKRGYAALDFYGLQLLAGKDSQWWGPGRHGSILLSNNAEPLPMIRLSTPSPVALPWVLSALGPFRFSFFISRLEAEREISNPYLWGLRLNFKPSRYAEIGLTRTALYGGKGREGGIDAFWRSFARISENSTDARQPGDQRAGADILLTIPFEAQPMQLYAEAAGEDESGGLPYKWAYLAGLYLPRIGGLEKVDLRAEYASTWVEDSPGVWYSHSLYTSGYTYKGRTIGHHMGKDARDLYIESSWFDPASGTRVALSYDREKYLGNPGEVRNEAGLRISKRFNGIILGILYRHGWLDKTEAAKRDSDLFSAEASYRF